MFGKNLKVDYEGLEADSSGLWVKVKVPKVKGELELIGARSIKLDLCTLKRNTTEARLKISEKDVTPDIGVYSLILKIKKKEYKQYLKYEGGKLSVSKRKFYLNEYKSDMNYMALNDVELTIHNSGDLPVFIKYCRVIIDNSEVEAELRGKYWITPNSDENVYADIIKPVQGTRIWIHLLNEENRQYIEYTEIIKESTHKII